ncbi:XRE family transcriptional regulator [Rhodococcus hoagii]|nr:XRE family transcriptional regulator [Prescottella equi]MBM4654097.1 XRE family transcriptional regulator [Prescottella equi]MBM4719571.1 XRE family transcriptional regulator [Prescottella equi]NKR23370.1 XRE family transcriptional regulator [Prescottella equi]NKT56019.1 XRE family transcriptional regulator [Prescottella equi]
MSDNDGSEFLSVWDALCDTPDEAAILRLRSDLMNAIRAQLDRRGWTGAVAASHLGVDVGRISALYRGKLSEFPVEDLISLGSRLDVRVAVQTA